MIKKEMTITEFASKGGTERAKRLSKERRKEIASKGGKARWAKRKLSTGLLTSSKDK